MNTPTRPHTHRPPTTQMSWTNRTRRPASLGWAGLVRGGERGSLAVEAAVLTPVLLLVLALIVIAGRVAVAGISISGVAGTAARDASLQRTPTAARAAAQQAAAAALSGTGLHCADQGQVSVDTSNFTATRGSAVSVTVTCVVQLADVALPGMPGTRTLVDHAVSPVDPYRSAP